MLDQAEQAAGDQVPRRLVAGHQQQQEEGGELLRRQAAAVDLGVHQLARQVVARIRHALGGQLVGVHEELGGRDLRRRGIELVLGVVVAEHLVAPVEDPVTILERDADQLDDDPERQLGRDGLDEVALPGPDHVVDQLVADVPHVLLEAPDHAARKAQADQAPEAGVIRRVQVDEQPLLRLVLVLGPVAEDRSALRRGECLRVQRDLEQVAVLGDRPELPPVRRLVP